MIIKYPEIVAEIGAAHNGSYQRAADTIRAAARAGANAIKLQTFDADTMVADADYVIQAGPWCGKVAHDLYAKAATPRDWHKPLFNLAASLGMTAFSTPFDETAVDFLESINCPRYKVASFELTDLRLIRRIASTGKPMVLSTGMGTMSEICDAVAATKGCPHVTLLKCTSAYPALDVDMNLAAITTLINNFPRCDVGLSDHTNSTLTAAVAVGLGVKMIEKHIHLSDEGGLDDNYAVNPDEFATMVWGVRKAADMLGNRFLGVTLSEQQQNSQELRRGLYARCDIPAGTRLTAENCYLRRPARGVPAALYDQAIGMPLLHAVKARRPIEWSDIIGKR